MMHMGEGNWRMARRGEPVHVVRSTLTELMDVRTAPLLLAFNLEPGEVTCVRVYCYDRTSPAGRPRSLQPCGLPLKSPAGD